MQEGRFKLKALISIDYTNDFVADEGALTTGKAAQDLAPYIVNLTQEFHEQGDFIVYGIDIHDATDIYHPENKLYPPHNQADSWGHELYGAVKTQYEQIKADSNVLWIDKRHYSAFSGTDLHIRLRERAITEVHLVGVVTDICVLHTAIDAYNLGYQIIVHEGGVNSFNAAGHQWALTHFESTLGAIIIKKQ